MTMGTSFSPVIANLALGSDAQGLERIHEAGVNIAIWQRSRTVDPGTLETVLLGLAGEVRASGCVTAIMQKLEDQLVVLGFEAEALVDDIGMVLDRFAAVSRTREFRLSLSPVNTNMCRRFHTDVNDLRLLCTYVGPGTLWLPNDAVNEKAIRSNDPHLPIERSPEEVQQVGTGHVAIIKGALYPGDRLAACVHRSPTIEETGQQRLLLRIDTNGPMLDL